MSAPSEGQYWSLDIPGLTEAEARQLAEWVEANRAGWFGKASALDPRETLTLHLDRDSVEALHEAFESARESGGQGLREVIAAWLEWSSAQGA
jgi:hypothetical protein